MPEASFTISHLAAAADVHIETVRYYQRRGLLNEPRRPAGGIRRYGAHDLHRLQFIRRAKAMGFSLDEIGSLLSLKGQNACEETRKVTELKLADVRRRLTELAALEKELAGLAAACGRSADSDLCPTLAKLERPLE